MIVAGVVTALVAGAGGAVADPLAPPIKVELPAIVEGTFDPPDLPLITLPDTDVLGLDVPRQHPWLLFDRSELPALRERVLGADPDSVLGRAWTTLLERADACCEGRTSLLEGVLSFPERDVGRDDLAELGFVWQITGDDQYLQKAKQLLRYVAGTFPDHGAPIEPGVDEFYIQRAHRLNGFAQAYDLLHPGLDPAERTLLLGVVTALGAQQLAHAHSAWWALASSGSNIGAVNAAALGVAGLVLWHEVPGAPAWTLRGEQLTRAYFHEGFGRQGAGIEGILYGNYGMRVPTFLEHGLIRAGHTNDGRPGITHLGGVDRQQEWSAYEVLPGGGAVNPVNDARYHEFNPYFTTWSSTHGDTPELSRWLFDEIVLKDPAGPGVGGPIPTLLWYEPSDPGFDPGSMLPLAKLFPDRGLVHVRSGWEDDALMASFEARQNDWGEAVHQNQDVNSFTLYAEGARLVVDSRYSNWLSKTVDFDAGGRESSTTQAHNYLVADGRSQDFFGKGDLQVFTSTADRVGETGGLDLAVGDARKAYMLDQPRRAERVFLHVRADEERGLSDYVVVADRFRQDEQRHRHSWFLHTDWANEMSLDGPGSVRIDAPNGAGLDLTMHARQPFEAAVGSFTPDDAEDWEHLGPGNDGRKSHDRLRVSSSGESFESIAVLAPTAPGEVAPEVSAVEADGGIALRVDHGEVQDTLLLATGTSDRVRAGDLDSDGLFSMVRTDAGGEVLSYAMVDGSQFDRDGRALVSLDGGDGTLVAHLDTASVVGDGVVADLLAPVETTVSLNGVAPLDLGRLTSLLGALGLGS